MMFTGNNQPSSMNPQQQEEKLQTIGAQIRQVREQQSMSLEEVETKTRIQARLLRAIEQGDLNQLPEPVYLKGLIKQFADAVGLEGAEYAQQFPTVSQIYNIKPSWQPSSATVLRPLHLYLGYVLLVILSLGGLSYVVDQKLTPPQSEISDPEWAVVTSSQTKPVKVKVSIEQDVWLEVISDGEQVHQGTLSAGETQSWTAQEELTLRTGEAGSMVVEYHYQQTTKLGESGEMEEVTYSPSNQQ